MTVVSKLLTLKILKSAKQNKSSMIFFLKDDSVHFLLQPEALR